MAARYISEKLFSNILALIDDKFSHKASEGYIRASSEVDSDNYGHCDEPLRTILADRCDSYAKRRARESNIIIEANSSGLYIVRGQELFSPRQLDHLRQRGAKTKVMDASWYNAEHSIWMPPKEPEARKVEKPLNLRPPVEPVAWAEKRERVAALRMIVDLRNDVRAMVSGNVQFHDDSRSRNKAEEAFRYVECRCCEDVIDLAEFLDPCDWEEAFKANDTYCGKGPLCCP